METPSQLAQTSKNKKRGFVRQARRAMLEVDKLPLTGKPPYHKHVKFSEAVTGLWLLGYWPQDMANYIGQGIEESVILMVLRRSLLTNRAELVKLLVEMIEENRLTSVGVTPAQPNQEIPHVI